MFYSKSHRSLPRAIEQVNSNERNYTRTIITLPPDCVDEQTDEEELDDYNLASEDIPLEVEVQFVHNSYGNVDPQLQ